VAQTFYPITPVEVTPGTASAWTDVDVSAYVPAGATGVILHCVNTHASNNYALGLRKNGSTDARTTSITSNAHCWAAIGVDANRIFEAYIGNTTYIDIYLVGYTVSGVTFFTNAYDKSKTTLTTWEDIDCSTEAPSAIGLIFEVKGSTAAYAMGLRTNGSTDNRTASTLYHDTFGVIIGCDASQICEGYIENVAVDFFLVGYITDGCTFNTNATDVSLATTATWLDLTALPATANMGFIEVTSGGAYNYGLRKNGSAEDIYKYAFRHPWAFVECDASQIIEGEIANVAVDFFVVGYATAVAVVQLSAVSAGVCSVSGAIRVARALAAASAGIASVSGAIRVARSLSAISQGVASVTASLTKTKWLSAISAGVATVSGSIRVARALSAVSAGIASVAGSLGILRGLSATIAGSSIVTASLFHVRKGIKTLAAVRNLLAVRNIPPVR